MESSEYKTIFENEETHFYYQANHKILLSLIARYTKKNSNNIILDAGCGTGLFAKKLSQFGTVTGIDIHPHALSFSRRRGVRVRKASVESIPFKDNTFDIVASIDVIYHKAVVDDIKALREFIRVLKPGGLLVLRVPSVNWLRRTCDAKTHTRERYTYDVLKKRLQGVGFSIKRLSYINLILLPPALAAFVWEKMKKTTSYSSPLTKLPFPLNAFVSFVLTLELHLLNWIDLPLGLGLVAVCKKPKGDPMKLLH